jgi:hypothetical protein
MMTLFPHIPDEQKEVPERRDAPMRPDGGRPFVVVSYGGGTDSTALLVEAHNRGMRPDLILFADTGSEMPHTYAYLPVMAEWCAKVGFPEIQVVRWTRQDGRFLSLHEWCIERGELPSKAYGFSGCTSKWKQHPLDKAVGIHPGVLSALEEDRTVERWLGYDAREAGRVANIRHKPPPYLWRAPLFEWNIAREQCREIIAAAGLPQPGKSSCWMCPMMRGHEIDRLAAEYPHLAAKAVEMENAGRANGSGDIAVRGLGMNTPGRAPWSAWIGRPQQQALTFGTPPEEDDEDEKPCGCHD